MHGYQTVEQWNKQHHNECEKTPSLWQYSISISGDESSEIVHAGVLMAVPFCLQDRVVKTLMKGGKS